MGSTKGKVKKTREKTYKLADMSLVILGKITSITPPTIISYGKYNYKNTKGAYFAEAIHKTSTTTIFKLMTKDIYINNTPKENLFKGAKFVMKAYPADKALALPIQKTGRTRLTISQMKQIEKAFAEKGLIEFDCPEEKF